MPRKLDSKPAAPRPPPGKAAAPEVVSVTRLLKVTCGPLRASFYIHFPPYFHIVTRNTLLVFTTLLSEAYSSLPIQVIIHIVITTPNKSIFQHLGSHCKSSLHTGIMISRNVCLILVLLVLGAALVSLNTDWLVFYLARTRCLYALMDKLYSVSSNSSDF